MTEERRIEVEVEVPVTPEEAWEAIATGPGITAWFMPAEVEGHVGGSVTVRPDRRRNSVCPSQPGPVRGSPPSGPKPPPWPAGSARSMTA